MNSFYSEDELRELGLKKYGTNVKISRNASLYGRENIEIGNDVRVDDFCILSGRICLGNNIHIAAYAALYGGEEGIFISDFVNISSRVCIYSVSDDYSGESMTNPTVPEKYKHVISAPVQIEKHVIIGSTSVILPGVKLAEGSAFGAFSFVNKSVEPWGIYAGIPCKRLKERSRHLIEYEQDYVSVTASDTKEDR